MPGEREEVAALWPIGWACLARSVEAILAPSQGWVLAGGSGGKMPALLFLARARDCATRLPRSLFRCS
jgi:hypothetical protein